MYVCKYFVSEGTLDVWNAELCLYRIITERTMLDDALHLAYLALHLEVSELPDAVVADVDDQVQGQWCGYDEGEVCADA